MVKNKTKTKDSEKNTDINFSLKGLDILGVEIKAPSINLPDKVVFNYNIDIEYNFNIEKKLLFLSTSIKVTDSKENKTEFGSIKTSCYFEIGNIQDYIQNSDKNPKVILPQEISTIFNSIAISTTRGMMYTLFRGTILHNAFLPIVDPKKLGLMKEKNV